LRISGIGMSPRDTVLIVQDGLAEARIDGIPIGERSVEAGLEDSEGTRLWEGDAQVTILANQFAEAAITLARVGNAPPVIGQLDIDPATPQAGTPFTLRISAEDAHDSTDALQVRWDLDNDGSFDPDWSFEKELDHTFEDPGTYTVKLEVQDRSGLVNTTTQQIEVVAEPFVNTPPIANAGPDQNGSVGATVRLNGLGSTDTDGDALGYEWTQSGGPTVVLAAAGTAQASFTPDQEGTYTFSLVVNDDTDDSAPDEVVIRVQAAAAVVVFADAALEETVRQVIGKQTGDILVSEVATLTVLVASEKGIVRLDGLEHFTGLTTLDLSMNQISDLTPLAGLTRLVVLDLGQNQISDLLPLAGLIQLLELKLWTNRINDLSALEKLIQLIELDLSGNRISDLSSLVGLDQLIELDLDSNQITDVTPLLELDKLQVVVLQSNNELSDTTYDSLIPALQANGVEVDFNTPPVANAGPDQDVVIGVTVVLDGSGSSDLDGDGLSYEWTAPEGITLSSTTDVRVEFTANTAGSFLFTLVVNDGTRERSDQVVINVIDASEPIGDIVIEVPLPE
jgi:PKD repeat protein